MHNTPRILTLAILVAIGATGTAIAANTGHPAAGRALGLIDGNPGATHRADADRFIVKDVIVDADGTEHVRVDRTYRGLPVIGGDMVVHSRNGQFKSASLTLKGTGRPGLDAAVRGDDATVTAGADFGSDFEGIKTARKVIYARGASPKLAYEVVFAGTRGDQTPTEMHYFVDANSGKILAKWDSIHTGKPGGSTCSSPTAATGLGHSLFSGDIALGTQTCSEGGFQMKDPSRGGGYTTDLKNRQSGNGTIFSDADNTWGNYTNGDRATAGADAHFGVSTTWDYYKNIHGRSGIRNDGVGALSRVHYGRNYVNAFWSDSCFCMTYGDGDGTNYAPLVTLDIAGHEMSHGVTSRTAGLVYSGESGGLNEATSDIFGTMVEFYAGNASDVADYVIGEKIYINFPAGDKGLRYMFEPFKDARSPNCYSGSIGSLDVHYSSGVANHFFFLLAEGSGAHTFNGVDHTSPTCNGSSIAGIGRTKAQAIWYKALTTQFTSNTNYAGARTGTLNAAASLYGNGSAEYNAVAAAWSAVSVN